MNIGAKGVLIIDDEESIRKVLAISLRSDGYEVLTAENGEKGIELFKEKRPPIVLVDIKMPGLDGIEVLKRTKKIDPDTEVIMITGHGDYDLAIEALRLEASNFLNKPISDELLSISLSRCEERIAMKKRLREHTIELEKRVEEVTRDLKKALDFQQNLIESTHYAIVAVDRNEAVVVFNKGAEKLLGYSKDEVIGKKNIEEFYPPGVPRQLKKWLYSEDNGGVGKLEKRQLVLINKDQEQIPVDMSAAILFDDGEEVGSVGIFSDLRERKKLEQQLLHSEKLSSLGELAAGISHEINQPLVGIMTFAHMLLKKHRDDEQSRKDLETIIRETTRISDIVKGVLDFAGRSASKIKHEDMNVVVDNTLSIVEKQAIFHNIKIIKDLDNELPLVMIDPNQLQQVLMNLFINAAHAMEDREGTLSIQSRKALDGPFVEIMVADTGKGISEEELGRIFDPFFTTKDEKSGMGLGLSVSYGIVKSHKGDLLVESEEGKGTTFTLRLPLPSI